MLCTAVPFFVGATWRLPDTYHSAGLRRGTATLKFYEDRDILLRHRGRSRSRHSDRAMPAGTEPEVRSSDEPGPAPGTHGGAVRRPLLLARPLGCPLRHQARPGPVDANHRPNGLPRHEVHVVRSTAAWAY